MQVYVYEDRSVVVRGNSGTENENNIETMEFTLPEGYKNYNKKIVFILPETENNVVWDIIEDDKYILKKNVTKYPKVNFYIWLTHNEDDFRSVTTQLYFRSNQDASEEITEEEIGTINKLLAELEFEIEQTNNLNIQMNKKNGMATITLTNKDGIESTVNIYDGEKGDKGEKGEPGYTPEKGIDYYTAQEKQQLLTELDNNIKTYINKPFVNFKIENGNLIVEVEEYGNN